METPNINPYNNQENSNLTNSNVGNQENMNEEKTSDNKPNSGSAGPIIGSIIVIVVIILGGLYFFSQKTSNLDDIGQTGDDIRLEEDQATANLGNQSNSDEVTDIETDLNNTELENLDQELGNIDAELSL